MGSSVHPQGPHQENQALGPGEASHEKTSSNRRFSTKAVALFGGLVLAWAVPYFAPGVTSGMMPVHRAPTAGPAGWCRT